ncbi:Uncaracterized surface protein containing fasciclin (FAS1) repeats [Mucilaginibacter gossypiicola]|uniref:Uncaracterized surface protein containing fasciclin (FAS1) repeats n=2 Tax=Mucilaginibacter gossypiicola TaxID=551995 RepID=A0A1H8GAH3_9SPHI|nr:Uncaracterized surface protein containing fasciclin (FAS1) repeats [Mucilaginibacter gossypiicola]
MNMKKSVLIAVASLAIGFFSTQTMAQTQDTTKKDTAKTTAAPAATSTAAASNDVVGVMATSTNYAPMALAIKSAQLEPTLQAPGPFTIFAPNDVAFSKLPKAQFDALMKDPAKFAPILKYHVVAGKYTKADIIKALGAGKGKADLKTIDGQTLHLSVNDKSNLQIVDAKGAAVLVTSFDTEASNGVIHGVNGIMTP